MEHNFFKISLENPPLKQPHYSLAPAVTQHIANCHCETPRIHLQKKINRFSFHESRDGLQQHFNFFYALPVKRWFCYRLERLLFCASRCIQVIDVIFWFNYIVSSSLSASASIHESLELKQP